MQENLVIVESPAKAKTIEKFLGKEYMVKSSFGHIRDLSKKELGIDIDHNFEPHYEIPADKKKLVTELGKLAKSAKTVWLASLASCSGVGIGSSNDETHCFSRDHEECHSSCRGESSFDQHESCQCTTGSTRVGPFGGF